MEKPILAVDIGGTKLLCGVIMPDGKCIVQCRRPLIDAAGFGQIREALLECAKQLRPYAPSGFCAVGVTIPGLADAKRGMWVFAPHSHISDVPVVKILKQDFKVPVFLENDVNSCALAERYFGNCRGKSDYLWITVSTGIGGGLILNGKLFTGQDGNAGEVGHIIVERDEAKALRCGCGHRGCAEAMASGTGIARRYMQLVPGASQTVTAEQIAELARSGDEAARQIYKETGVYLARAIGAAVNTLNLACVILGGGVAMAFDLFEDALRSTLAQEVFTQGNPGLEIMKTALGYEAALYGAAALALRGFQKNTPG